jgi:hypothetical protein
MLQITPSAAQVLRLVRSDSNIPESAAVRIQLVPHQEEPHPVIGLAFTEEPEAEDQPVTDDPPVVVAPELAGPLAGSILDTTETDAGVELQLRPQTPQNGQV